MTNKENNQENVVLETTENQQQELFEQKISKLEEDNKNLNDHLLRIAAELENTRKRAKEEVDKASKYAISSFVNDLVLVVENFYLAAENSPTEKKEISMEIKSFIDAMLMTKKDLSKILEKFGVKRIYPFGEKFDHNYHEAISQIKAIEGEETGIVKQVMQAGYQIGDRLIRPALVAVSQ